VVSWALNRCHQKVLTKRGSQSKKMVFGKLWRWQISTKKRLVMFWALKCVGKARKWAFLVRRSPMTHMIVWPAEDGKWVMKFMDKSSHTWARIGSGWSNPYGFCGRYFLHWHVEHNIISLPKSEKGGCNLS